MLIFIYPGLCGVQLMLCMAEDPENGMVVTVAQQKRDRGHDVKHTTTLTHQS